MCRNARYLKIVDILIIGLKICWFPKRIERTLKHDLCTLFPRRNELVQYHPHSVKVIPLYFPFSVWTRKLSDHLQSTMLEYLKHTPSFSINP